MRKVLIVSPVASHPPYRGNRQRILQIANLFSVSGYSIELAIGSNQPVTEDAAAFWPAIHQLKVAPGWKPSHKLSPLDSWYTPGLGEEIADLVKTRGIDVVLLNYVFHSRVLDFLPKSVVTIIDTHDVFTNRHDLYQGKRFAGGFFSCTAEDEKTYVSRADAIFALTDLEKDYFSALRGPQGIFEIPFASPTISMLSRDGGSTEGKRLFGMVLSANDLNLASLSDFIKAVDKEYGRHPPFTVTVAGGIHKIAYRYFPHRIPAFCRRWLKYLGEVSDINAFYELPDAVVVPVISGSGMAIKFAEAISRGLPTISTVAGSRGHATTNPLHNLPNNSELVRVLGDISSTQLQSLSASSALCHEATVRVTEKNWSLVNDLLANSAPTAPNVRGRERGTPHGDS